MEEHMQGGREGYGVLGACERILRDATGKLSSRMNNEEGEEPEEVLELKSKLCMKKLERMEAILN